MEVNDVLEPADLDDIDPACQALPARTPSKSPTTVAFPREQTLRSRKPRRVGAFAPARGEIQRGQAEETFAAGVSRICSVPPAIVRHRVLRKSCTRASTAPPVGESSIRISESAWR